LGLNDTPNAIGCTCIFKNTFRTDFERLPSPASTPAEAHAVNAVVDAAMWWLQLVGSFKLQVSFAKEPYKTDDILQKRLIILRSLLIIATPYVDAATFFSRV